MRLIRCLCDFKGTANGLSLAIGNFDGLHKGHQAVIRCMEEKARALNLESAVMIFEPQPLEFFSKQKQPARIYSLRDKLLALEVLGVKYVFCMKFNLAFASMSDKEFVLDLLHQKLGVKSVTVGSLFNFGQGGKYTIEDIKRLGSTVGMEASAIEGVTLNHERISSTKIREYLKQGQLDLAYEALGRYYSMSGLVVRGNQIGRTIGFPTANVNINRKITPLTGVYAVKVLTEYGMYSGMANVGYRPTVITGQKNALLEVNIFDFHQDLYAKSIRVFFIHKIRDEVKFENVQILEEQLVQDRLNAQAFFETHVLKDF